MSIQKKTIAIKVVIGDKVEEIDYIDVLLGIEEESVPYTIEKTSETNLIHISHINSRNSSLGVCVAILKEGIAVHYEKLEKEKPIILVKGLSKKTTRRAIGKNSARLVKKIPFVNLES